MSCKHKLRSRKGDSARPHDATRFKALLDVLPLKGAPHVSAPKLAHHERRLRALDPERHNFLFLFSIPTV